MRRRRLLAVAGAVVLVFGAAVAWTAWPRGTSAVSEDEALEDFRDRAEDAPDADAVTPPPGVYSYRAEGQEEVKLGPLPAETRPLPESVTTVVVAGGSGCFELTVNLFAEHVEDTRYCVDEAGRLSITGHTKHQQIGALSPTATMTCDPAVIADPDAETTSLTCSLTLDGGPTSISAALAGTASRAAAEQVTIAGQTVTVTPVTIDYDVTGDLTGAWTETLWLRDDNLPLRIQRQLDVAGPATLTEDIDLQLLDPRPRT